MLETRFISDVRAEKLSEVATARAAEAESAAANVVGVLGTAADGFATRNTVAGELIVTGTGMYRAIVNIPDGAALVEGMNVVRTTVEEQLNALQESE